MKLVERLRQQLHYIWFNYANFNGLVLLLAIIIAVSWVMGTMSTIQTNFSAQRALDERKQQLRLAQLEVETLKYEQNYYKSDEYKELEARSKLGLADPGEKQLILPENSAAVKSLDGQDDNSSYIKTAPRGNTPAVHKSNFQQWIDFLTGKTAASRLQK